MALSLPMKLAAVVFLVSFQLSFGALPIPDAAAFSAPLLTAFANASFTVQAFDIVHNPTTDGYIITASISSVSGAPPTGIKDASGIAKMKRTELINVTTGLVMHLGTKTAEITWGHRIFLLPKGSTIRAIVASNGKSYIAGVTGKAPSQRAFAAFLADGEIEYVTKYGTTDSSYTAISLVPGKGVAFGLWSEPGNGRQGNIVGVEKINLGSGAVTKSPRLIHKQAGRVITAERSFDIATIAPNVTISLTRVQTSDSNDRHYLSHDRVCSHVEESGKVAQCALIPVAGPTAATTQMVLAPTRIHLAHLIGVGAAEVMNVTSLDIDTLKPTGKIGTFELPTAEGEGARTRSNLAAMTRLPYGETGSEHRLRVLFTTGGPLDLEAAMIAPHGRVAILDFLADGEVGGRLLDTKLVQSVRPAALAPLLPKGSSSDTAENSIVIGTILATKRGSTGALYLKTIGDPMKTKSVDDQAPIEAKAKAGCIGHETRLNSVLVREVLRGKEGIRVQRHPLKWLYRQAGAGRVHMLCFEEGPPTTVCATEYHVLQRSGRAIYMKDLCAERGDCTTKYQEPINFKGKCGTSLPVSDKLHLTMHSATERATEADEVVYNECMIRTRAYPVWFFKTL